MIIPKNGHILIEPLVHQSFISSQKDTYEEVGTVVHAGDFIQAGKDVKVGDKVFFDSWLAAKFPKNDDEYFWLVKWEDVRAVEHTENDE